LQKSATSMTMRPMRTLFITLALVGFGCGDSGTKAADAPNPPPIDSPPAVKQDCPTFCGEVLANCTGANAQFPDDAHCEATCASWALGTAADKTGATLGCHIYHAGAPSMMTPTTHCVHAGPGGDLTTAAAPGTCGDACTNFCTLEIKACGSLDAPITGAPAQYQNTAACMTACAAFNKTNLYSITSKGDSLACRLYHATNAAITGNATVHCPHTAAVPAAGTPCTGAASP